MAETINDYPALQMEDDGFLLSLKNDFVRLANELFGVHPGQSLSDIIETLISENSRVTDTGSQLPLYIPIYSDDGDLVAQGAVPVWSGVHVDFPLYPGLAKESVRSFIYGKTHLTGKLGPDFMQCDPAFRLAILVHYALDSIIIHELAIEAFLLDRYEEIPLKDKHFEETKLPGTMLVFAQTSVGHEARPRKMTDGNLCISYGPSRTDGWTIRIRGAKPKEKVLRDCWQKMREINDSAGKPRFTIGGEEYSSIRTGESGRTKKRSGSQAVDYMVNWVDALQEQGGIPMKGSRIDWISINCRFENENPKYIGFWSADTMRRTYTRRKNNAI